jgi:hypothetical protein
MIDGGDDLVIAASATSRPPFVGFVTSAAIVDERRPSSPLRGLACVRG